MKNLVAVMFGILMIPTGASAVELGAGYKLGTVGHGIDISTALTKTINARVSITGIDIDGRQESVEVGDQGSSANVDASLDLDFGATSLLFDWYVFDGTFHLTAGMMKNDSKLSFDGSLQGSIVIDGQPLDSSDISGSISGNIGLGESFQPYFGIGWGRKAGIEPGFSVSVELGVALLDPSANLNATVNSGGTNGLNQASLNDRLRDIENDVESEMSILEAWPVLSIGINYAF